VHLMDGVIDSVPVLLGGTALAAAGVASGLWRMDDEKIPRTGVVAAAFFVASAIHVPTPIGAVHLTLVGLAGLILGWSVFPAMLVGLALQVQLLGFGGWTTLGLNTVAFALPAIICYYLFGRALSRVKPTGPRVFALGFAAGFLGMLLYCLVFCGILLLCGKEFRIPSLMVLLFHVPVLVVEGIVTGSVVVSLKRLRPEVFDAVGPAVAKEYSHA
jgi:cobalt/nickel transport system permease protein